jgi:hypothetical protein
MKNAKKPKKLTKPITTGQLNKVIDVFVHPFFKNDEKYVWLDGILHAIAEQDPQISMKKFVKYNLPKLLKQKSPRKHTDRERGNGRAGR